MNPFRGAILLALLLAGAPSCRRQSLSFQRLEVPAPPAAARLLRDGGGEPYFHKGDNTFRFGHRGRGLRLAGALTGPCCLDLQFWSPARGRLRLQGFRPGQGIFLAKEFVLRAGANEVVADMDLQRGDRLVLEAEQGGIFSRPILYRLLPAGERRLIFLISADSLGADHLPLYGYPRSTAPAVADFRRDGVLFRWAFASSPWTLPSHMSLFTSLQEIQHRVSQRVQNEEEAAAGRTQPVVQAYPLRRDLHFLVEDLSRSRIACGFSGGINLGAEFGFYRGFDLYAEAPNDHLDLRAAARLFGRVRRHLRQHRFPAAFYFLHTYQVHLPYRPPADLLERIGRPIASRTFDFQKDIGGITGIFRPGDERRRAEAAALYDAGIMEFDRRFGEFIAFLKQSGLYDRAMVILLADHGEEFLEHGSWAHGSNLFDSQLRVPLLVKFPEGRFAGRDFAGAVGLVDVLPTVLEYYGTAGVPAASGRSLLGELRGGFLRPRPVFSANLDCRSWSHLPAQAAWIEDGFKLIRHFPGPPEGGRFFDPPPPVFPALQLFRLADDPYETRDLTGRFPRLAARLNARLQDFLAGRGGTPGRPRPLPREALDALRTLGYIR